ncbi:Imm52 family immunity protein [Stenotrophomonas sp. NPDC101269]|uniref:Imm52 family immunity protein n=1 Tax=Stenotrophomonas TaxID=40323 RepID=UPI001292232F|nr:MULTISPECIES: Imm52 family immunity protein [Stenotrophomonas]MBD3774191.1 immunity 52 family protein [Paracoccaceae bacterium]
MNITLTCSLPAMHLDAAEAYQEAAGWIDRLASVHPHFEEWWVLPDGPNDHPVGFRDAAATLLSIQKADESFYREYPGAHALGSTGLVLTNGGTERLWKERGKVALVVQPASGEVALAIYRIEAVYQSPGQMVWSLLKALCSDPRVTYARTNVQALIAGRLVTYSVDCSVYPHRDFLGWMGYVDKPLSADQLPQAARLEGHGRGTLILSTEVLDLADHAAVEQVNGTEARLDELDLLPALTPSI